MRSLLFLVPLLLLAFVALPAVAEDDTKPAASDVESPAEAWQTYNRAVRDLPRAQQTSARVKLAEEYLVAWKLSGTKAEGDDWVYLGQFEVAAGRASAAFTCFQTAMAEAALSATERARAGQSVAALLANATHCDELAGENCTKDAVDLVMAWLGEDPVEGTEALCAAAHMSLAGFYARAEDIPKSVEHYMAAATLQPTNADRSGRSIGRLLMGSTHSMAEYPKVLESASNVQARLIELANEPLADARSALAALQADAAAGEKEKAMAERRLKSAEAGVERLKRMLVPFELLGNAAPAWTLEHAFGDVKAISDLKGKVVLVDFWATWCGWCIKSLPALRDLVRDYGDKGFSIVGVTASSSTVYDARYDLDDDMASKKTEGWRPTAAARVARGTLQPDPEQGIFAVDDTEGFRVAEQAAIGRFIANHEMSWPVVMIDKAEPSAKYALQGWPHAMVIDKQGRIRYFKVGALLRDREEQVKHFREVLEALLAE